MSNGELEVGEPHPAADSALHYLAKVGYFNLIMWQESFASCAIEGNRLAEICSETLDRLINGKPVSDRYLLGLAWVIRNNTNDKEAEMVNPVKGIKTMKSIKGVQGIKGIKGKPNKKIKGIK
jgi:S-adenosylmethionine:diacylglycerol 3-amino-3-carboxypropyl transferase